jgi:hypothetical protein
MSQNNTATLEKLWNSLSVVLNDAFNRKSIERDVYMKHYKSIKKFSVEILIFEICIFSLVVEYLNSDDYHNRLIMVPVKEPKSENTEDNQEEIIPPGGELYFNVKRFFKNFLENIAAVRESFLNHNHRIDLFKF